MDIQTEKGLREAFDYLERGNPAQASKVIQNSFLYDSTCRELIFTSDVCNRWIDFLNRIARIESPAERGEGLLAEWKNFQYEIQTRHDVYVPAVQATCRGVFSLALQNFNRLMNERNPVLRSDTLRKAGICYKKLGEFENARMCFTEANSLHPNQPAVMADLADCYALCGEDKPAKVLFREAFYVDPKQVDIDFLDSGLIRCLIEKVEEKGYSGDALKEWIPVYGVLWGVFTIKRTLRPQEAGKLKQEIYALESENKDPSRATELLPPRLINKYFWLIDNCQKTNDGQLISEILLKIKILDTNIYNLYTK